MERYLLNIKTGTIHNGITPCGQAKRMKESNKKRFDSYYDAVNFFDGDKRGEPCGICLGDQQNKK